MEMEIEVTIEWHDIYEELPPSEEQILICDGQLCEIIVGKYAIKFTTENKIYDIKPLYWTRLNRPDKEKGLGYIGKIDPSSTNENKHMLIADQKLLFAACKMCSGLR